MIRDIIELVVWYVLVGAYLAALAYGIRWHRGPILIAVAALWPIAFAGLAWSLMNDFRAAVRRSVLRGRTEEEQE